MALSVSGAVRPDASEFRLYFQPKVDMRSAKVLGVEALLRWKHPEQGVISPAQFPRGNSGIQKLCE